MNTYVRFHYVRSTFSKISMTNSLNTFIAHATSKGMDLQTVRLLLLSAGWKEKDISSALASETLDMPVPVPSDGGGARDAFFHLLTFTTLYATVIATIVLVFTYINRYFPDAANGMSDIYANSDASGIRWSLAVVMVSFPLFAFLSRVLHRELILHPEKLASGIRKWLTYLTLFVTACTLIGDVITLFFYLLNGELSMRFILKIIAILVLSGMPFWYYFSVVRMDPKKYAESTMHKLFLLITSVIVVLTFVWGIAIVGSPSYGREQKFDEQRISDIRQIHEEILNQVYGESRYAPNPVGVTKILPKPLPKDLQTVADNAQYTKISLTDPQTGEPYEYVRQETSFNVCATFHLERDLSYDIFWNHPAGHHCFTFDALDSRSK